MENFCAWTRHFHTPNFVRNIKCFIMYFTIYGIVPHFYSVFALPICLFYGPRRLSCSCVRSDGLWHLLAQEIHEVWSLHYFHHIHNFYHFRCLNRHLQCTGNSHFRQFYIWIMVFTFKTFDSSTTRVLQISRVFFWINFSIIKKCDKKI